MSGTIVALSHITLEVPDERMTQNFITK